MKLFFWLRQTETILGPDILIIISIIFINYEEH